MTTVTPAEVAALRKLAEQPRAISGNKRHGDFSTLVGRGYVKATATSLDTVLYEIMPRGLDFLADVDLKA